ncbi:MAG TPA: SURF1 family protein [Rhizomicrobium sp.]|nr:SURF1 family protein [Rhizomicrobium sp.]
MTFRPYPGLTIACTLLFAVLCGLGTWQLQRLQWKLALIARVNSHIAAAPLPLDRILATASDDAQYRRVAVTGRFDHAREAYVFTTDQGAAVYHVLTPLRTDDGKVLMVDRGEVPKEKIDPATRAAGNVTGKVHVIGVWRVPDPPGAFTPPPDAGHRIWFARDLAAISAADHLSLTAPVVIEADATPNPGGWPRGGQTVVNFRNQHLSYAVTWFGLALCLLGVWLAYHISKGRIAFR